jgi:glycine/D-amino acid oxidase-like deaminating enzyme
LAKQEKHVVVIGAGVGGLTAASLLLKAGFPVTVLEALMPGRRLLAAFRLADLTREWRKSWV